MQRAMSVSPTKALLQGLGSAVQWVITLPMPFCGASAVLCGGCLSYQGFLWGLSSAVLWLFVLPRPCSWA